MSTLTAAQHQTHLLEEARKGNSPGLALQATARAEEQIELEARLLGELSDSVKVAVGINVNKAPDPLEEVVTLAQVFTAEELQEFHRRLLAHKEQKSASTG